MRDTRHLYLLQTRLADRIRAWVDGKARFPPLTRAIAYKHLDEGLVDRGVTRDLSWGVPVLQGGFPRPGFEDKVFYVWFDAPIEYIGATAEWAGAHDAGDARTTSPSTPSTSSPPSWAPASRGRRWTCSRASTG